jgi:hypothetical protein
MRNSKMRFVHYFSMMMFGYYRFKEIIKCFFIKRLKGKEALRDYHCSKLELPLTFYVHMEMVDLSDILNVDVMGWELFVDIHLIGVGKLGDPAMRQKTLMFLSEYDKETSQTERRLITLQHLLLTGDITDRQLLSRKEKVDAWLACEDKNNA